MYVLPASADIAQQVPLHALMACGLVAAGGEFVALRPDARMVPLEDAPRLRPQ